MDEMDIIYSIGTVLFEVLVLGYVISLAVSCMML